MPGIEAAAIDSRGRIVTQMEAALEHYPVSEQGQRHRTRVEQLGTEIGLLLNKLVNTGEVRFVDVVSADDGIEQMWVDEIHSLPPIAFLQRPAYPYDALMFTHDGASPAYLRLFDPAARSLRTLFHSPQMRAHDMTLSWDAKTIFIGGGGVVAEVGVDGAGYRVISTGQSPTELPDGRVIFFDDTAGISPCKATGVRRLLLSDGRRCNRRAWHRDARACRGELMSRTERDLLLELAGRARRRWREARDRGEREYWRLRFAQLGGSCRLHSSPLP